MISNLFAFVLIGVFAVMSTLLVLYAARGYQDAVTRSDKHNVNRVAGAFILGAVRAEDVSGAVTVNRVEDTDVLEIRSTYDEDGEESVYVRRLYCTNGMLKDLFTAEYDSESGQKKAFSPSDPLVGNEICALQEMKLTLEDALLTAELTYDDGTVNRVYAAVRTESGL